MYIITVLKPIRKLPRVPGVSRRVTLLPNGAIRLGAIMIAAGQTRALSASMYWPHRKMLEALDKLGLVSVTQDRDEVVPRVGEQAPVEISIEDVVVVDEEEEETTTLVDPAVSVSTGDLGGLSVAELKGLCDDKGIEYRSNTSKKKLIGMLR